MTTKEWVNASQSLLIDAGLSPYLASSYSILADYYTPEEFVEECCKNHQPSKSQAFVWTPNGI